MSDDRSHLRRLRDEAIAEPRLLFLLGAVVVWSVFVVDGVMSPGSLPHERTMLLAAPLGLAALMAAQGGGASLLTRLAAGWSAVLAGALLTPSLISSKPSYALAVPIILSAAAVCARRPAMTVIVLFVATGSYNSVIAFTHLPLYQFADALIVALLIAVLWPYALGARIRRVWVWPGVAAAILYLFITALEIPLAATATVGWNAFHAASFFMLAFLLVGYAAWSPRTYDRIAKGLLVVALLVGAYATLRWVIGPAAAEKTRALSDHGRFNFLGDKLVLLGSFGTGHHLGAWTSTIAPYCFALSLTFRGWWRWVAVAGCGLCVAALVGSEVRAGIAGLGVGLAIVLVLYQFSRGFPGLHLGATSLAVLGVVVAATIVFTNPAHRTRYEHILSPTQDTAFLARTYKWDEALSDLARHPYGHGLGTAGVTQVHFGRFSTVATYDIDNSYLKIALDQGIAVALLYAASLVMIMFGLARRALLTRNREKAGVAIGACAALASFAIIIFTGVYIEGLTALALWVVVGLGVAQFATGEARSELEAPGEEVKDAAEVEEGPRHRVPSPSTRWPAPPRPAIEPSP